MNSKFSKTIRVVFILSAVALFTSGAASADSIMAGFDQARSGSFHVLVVCDAGTIDCNAKTPEYDFEGVVFLYNSMLRRQDRLGPEANSDTLTLEPVAGVVLPRHTVFIDASESGSATYRGFTLVQPTAPIETPEAPTLVLLALGVLGLGWTALRLKSVV